MTTMNYKSIQGSFHQGDPKFGHSAGKQCTCCSLFAIAFTLCKSPSRWNNNDLDFIVEYGDLVYKGLNTEKYLMIPDLPNSLFLLKTNIRVEMLESTYGVISGCNQTGLILPRNQKVDYNAAGVLFILKGICISIIWTKKHYFIFDSHSKNE